MRGMGRVDPDLDPKLPHDQNVLRLILPFLWPRADVGMRVRLVVSVVLLLVTAALTAVAPLLLSLAVDHLARPEDYAFALPLGLLLSYGAASTMGKAIGEWRWMLYGPIEQRLRRSIGLTVFRHVHNLSLRFHISRRTGQLSRIIDNGTRAIETILFSMVFAILPLVAQLVFVAGILLGKLPSYTAIIGATAVLYTIVLVRGSSWMREHQRKAVQEGAIAHGQAVDSLLNYETVKYFGNEEFVATRYDRALHEVERLQVKALFARSVTGGTQVLILGVGQAIMIVLAGYQVVTGKVTVGEFVLVNTYLLQILQPLDRMGQLYRQLKQAFTEIEQMMVLITIAPEVSDLPDAKPLPPGPGTVTFRDVSFHYDPRRPVLEHVSFEVPAGKTVGLVGTSGAGKTTLGRLLFRFYDPTTGSVEIDGTDIRTVTADSVRAATGVVPQDTVLFNDTLLSNISFGRPGCSREDVENAARMAQIHTFIASLPDGYETIVGERGLKLSGGEKQRVAIARVILKHPRIFLFDEATSALDSKTEHAIQDSLREVSRGTTTLIIAHRLSSVIHADQILVIEDGKVAERGTHDALLRDGGRYAALWARQQRQRVELDAAD